MSWHAMMCSDTMSYQSYTCVHMLLHACAHLLQVDIQHVCVAVCTYYTNSTTVCCVMHPCLLHATGIYHLAIGKVRCFCSLRTERPTAHVRVVTDTLPRFSGSLSAGHTLRGPAEIQRSCYQEHLAKQRFDTAFTAFRFCMFSSNFHSVNISHTSLERPSPHQLCFVAILENVTLKLAHYPMWHRRIVASFLESSSLAGRGGAGASARPFRR